MFVQSCAPATDITGAGCATARRAGRDPNAMSQQASVKCPAATDTVAVLRATATANVGGEDNSANYVSITYRECRECRVGTVRRLKQQQQGRREGRKNVSQSGPT